MKNNDKYKTKKMKNDGKKRKQQWKMMNKREKTMQTD